MSEQEGPEPLLPARDLAKLLSLGEPTITAWRHYGDIPAWDLGGSVRYRFSEVLQWIKSGGPQRALDARKAKEAARRAAP